MSTLVHNLTHGLPGICFIFIVTLVPVLVGLAHNAGLVAKVPSVSIVRDCRGDLCGNSRLDIEPTVPSRWAGRGKHPANSCSTWV